MILRCDLDEVRALLGEVVEGLIKENEKERLVKIMDDRDYPHDLEVAGYLPLWHLIEQGMTDDAKRILSRRMAGPFFPNGEEGELHIVTYMKYGVSKTLKWMLKEVKEDYPAGIDYYQDSLFVGAIKYVGATLQDMKTAFEVCEYLIAIGFDLVKAVNRHETLYYSTAPEYRGLIGFLLRKGADINRPVASLPLSDEEKILKKYRTTLKKHPLTALQVRVEYACGKVEELKKSKKTDPEEIKQIDDVCESHCDILLRNGADATLKNFEGRTPAEAAKHSGLLGTAALFYLASPTFE